MRPVVATGSRTALTVSTQIKRQLPGGRWTWGRSQPLTKIMVYNRCDGNVSGRAAKLKVLFSEDGTEWTQFYQHDGTNFLGQKDGRPLVVPAQGETARFVRIQIPGPQYLHLDEVEVFGGPDETNLALGRPADQSSVAEPPGRRPACLIASRNHEVAAPVYPTQEVVERGLELAESLRAMGVGVALLRSPPDRRGRGGGEIASRFAC